MPIRRTPLSTIQRATILSVIRNQKPADSALASAAMMLILAPYETGIGSDAKANILRRDIAEAGLPEEAQRAFHCPIGVDIGTNHPYEIALSVIAQLIQTRDRNALIFSSATSSSPPA